MSTTAETDLCCMCLEVLPCQIELIRRMTCCGKSVHDHCFTGFIDHLKKTCKTQKAFDQKNRCPLCRKPAPDMAENIRRIRGWVVKGKAWAQCNLAFKYERGIGVKMNLKKAIDYYSLASKQGWITAHFALGTMYSSGQFFNKGFKQSAKKAAVYFELGSKGGCMKSTVSLGNLYVNGEYNLPNSFQRSRHFSYKGLPKSYKRASELFEFAAQNGDAVAQCALGALYAEGDHPTGQSFESARMWFLKSAEQGHQTAIDHLKLIDRLQASKNVVPILRCYTCGVLETATCKLNTCLCKLVHYCAKSTGRKCQSNNWNEHKGVHKHKMKKIAAAATAVDEAIAELAAAKKTVPKKASCALFCSMCSKPETSDHKLNRCKCHSLHYCNSVCQKNHWNAHKREHRLIIKKRNGVPNDNDNKET